MEEMGEGAKQAKYDMMRRWWEEVGSIRFSIVPHSSLV